MHNCSRSSSSNSLFPNKAAESYKSTTKSFVKGLDNTGLPCFESQDSFFVENGSQFDDKQQVLTANNAGGKSIGPTE